MVLEVQNAVQAQTSTMQAGFPTNYSGLVAWQKADAITGYNDGDTLTSWVGSINGYNATQNSTIAMPTYKTNIKNGLPAVRFNFSASQTLIYDNATVKTSWTNIGYGALFAVVKANSTINKSDVMFIETGTSVGRLGFAINESGYSGSFTLFGRRLDGDSPQFISTGSTGRIVEGSWYIVTVLVEWANAIARIRVNGVTAGSSSSFQTSGNTSNTASNSVAIGSSNGSFYMDGDIGEVVWYNQQITEAQAAEIENYLNKKWNVYSTSDKLYVNDATQSQTPSNIVFIPHPIGYPRDYSGLVAWHDASAIQGLNDGDIVTSWVDLSDNAYNMTQYSTRNLPHYKVNILNGSPVVRFVSASSETIAMTQVNARNSWRNIGYGAFFMVLKLTSATVKSMALYIETATAVSRFAIVPNETGFTGQHTLGGRRLDADPYQRVSGYTVDTSKFIVITGLVEWANRILTMRINGQRISTITNFEAGGNTSDTASTVISIGSSGGGFWMDGDVAEVVWYNAQITENQASEIEGYLSRKWNVYSTQSAIQSHVADNVALTQHQILSADNTVCQLTSDNINLTFYPATESLTIQNSSHSQTSDNITLDYYGVILDITNETGDFTQYPNETHTSGVTVTTDAGLVSTNYGINAQVYMGGNELVSGSIVPVITANEIRYRFYLDPNSIEFAEDDIAYIFTTFTTSGSKRVETFLSRQYGIYHIGIRMYGDNMSSMQSGFYIDNWAHWIELHETRSSGPGVKDGYAELFIDDILQVKLSFGTIITYNSFNSLGKFSLGASNTYISGGKTGSIHIDEATIKKERPSGGNKIGPRKGVLLRNTVQALASDTITLSQLYTLSTSDCTQTQTADNVNLTFYPSSNTLTVSNTTHGHNSYEYVAVTNDYILDKQYFGFYGMPLLYFPLEVSKSLTLVYHAPTNALTISNSVHVQASDNVALTQHQNLAISDAAHLQTADNVNLTQHQILSSNDIIHQLTSDNINLIQQQLLAIQNTVHTQSAENVNLLQYHVLTINSAVHAQISTDVSLTQHQILAVESTIHTQISGNTNLIQHLYGSLIVQNSTHSQTADTVELTQHGILTVDNATHAQIANNVDLIQHWFIIVNDTAHTQTADNVILVQHQVLVVNGTIHLQTVDNVDLVQSHVLSISDTSHPQAVDNITLAQNYVLIISDSNHLQVSDNITLAQNYVLLVNSATHLQTADNIDLAENYILSVDNANHSQTAEGVDLIQHTYGAITVDNSLSAQTSENIILTQHQILFVNDSAHAQTSENIILVQVWLLVVNNAAHNQITYEYVTTLSDYSLTRQYFGMFGMPALYFPFEMSNLLTLVYHASLAQLIVQNATHTLTSDKVVLVQHQIGVLSVDNSAHAQISDNINLVQHQTLTINYASQLHTATNVDLIQHYILIVQSVIHSQTANNIELTQNQFLVIQNAVHSLTSGNVDLNQHVFGALYVDNAIHLHSTSGIDLTQHQILAVQNSNNAQTSESVILLAHYTIVTDNSAHAQTSGSVTISVRYFAIAQDASHLQTAQEIGLTQHQILEVQNALHIHLVDNISLVSLIIHNSAHTQTADNVEIFFRYGIVVDSAMQLQTSDNVDLTQHTLLEINNIIHEQTSDNIALAQNYILSASNTTHAQYANNIALVYHKYYGYADTFERTLFIENEDRNYIVEYEDRNVYIEADDRYYVIENEDRNYIITPYITSEDLFTRTYYIVFEDRSKTITYEDRSIYVDFENRNYIIEEEDRIYTVLC